MVRTLDQAKRTAILAAAKSILLRDGYEATKMSDIAAEAGVAPGTLYLYFANKEALSSAIGEEFFSQLMLQLSAMIESIEDPDGVVSLIEWAAVVADRDRLMLAMARESHKGAKKENRKRFMTLLTNSLNVLKDKGTIRPYADVDTLGDLIMALLRRVIMAHAVYVDEDTERLQAGAVTVLQHALFDDVTVAASNLVKKKSIGS